ncbi:hypothetical protein GCM10009799_52120 [Nocardiopsis rhodophaea]|uniref:Uncharacterized protein n=1 Tax=Nocardiopsis rhodophaea TaxID=280238 RepID=A0ABP5F8V4_9ACTN
MPSLEQRVTSIERLYLNLAADQQTLAGHQCNGDDRINAIADGLVEHRREVKERFNQVDARFDHVDARFDQVDERLDRLEAGHVEIRDLLKQIVNKIDT